MYIVIIVIRRRRTCPVIVHLQNNTRIRTSFFCYPSHGRRSIRLINVPLATFAVSNSIDQLLPTPGVWTFPWFCEVSLVAPTLFYGGRTRGREWPTFTPDRFKSRFKGRSLLLPGLSPCRDRSWVRMAPVNLAAQWRVWTLTGVRSRTLSSLRLRS